MALRLTKTGHVTGHKSSVSLTGDVELMRLLENLPDKVFKKVIGKASRKAMAPVVKSARRKAPAETGLLRKSLGTKQKAYKKNGVTVTIVGPRKGFKSKVKVDDGRGGTRTESRNPANYAHLVEFGTRPHSTSAGVSSRSKDERTKAFTATQTTKHPGTQAQPFMRPAFDQNRGNIVRIMHEELAAGVVTEAKKLAATK